MEGTRLDDAKPWRIRFNFPAGRCENAAAFALFR